MLVPMKDTLLRSDCPICASRRLRYSFSHAGYRISRCADCAVMFSNPQPDDDELAAIYNADYFLGADTAEGRAATREMKRATARQYLGEIQRYCGAKNGRLLEVGCGDGDFLVEAEEAGFLVTGVELAPAACEQARERLKSGEVVCGLLENSGLEEELFDLCVLSDVIEHVRDPLAFLRSVHRLLKPGGAIFIATPSLDSWSAKLLRQNWMEFKPEHLTYFDPKTIQTALPHRLPRSDRATRLENPDARLRRAAFRPLPGASRHAARELLHRPPSRRHAQEIPPRRRQRHDGLRAENGRAGTAQTFRRHPRFQ